MSGLRFPPGLLATCCLPWTERYELDEPVFRRAIQTALRGTKGLYLFGTAGEGYAVTDRQFARAVEVFGEEMGRVGAEPMVGLIDLSLGRLRERLELARSLGVRLFQVVLPSWGALSDREVDRFFQAVCDGYTDCRFLHYNLPRAKRVLTGADYARLAARHGNLVATKNTGDSLSLLRGLLTEAPQLTHFLSEQGYVYGSQLGECGILASFVMNWPRLWTLYEAGRRGDLRTLAAMSRELDQLLATLFEAVPAGRMDGTYDKLFEKLYDREFSLRLLPPYEGASDAEFERFAQLLAERLPQWCPPPEAV